MVLIVQGRDSSKPNLDSNVTLTDYVAQELETDGRILPIAYSMTDPVFRAATLAGKLKDAPDWPTLDQSFGVARQLGADYVLVVEGTRVGKAIKSKSRLFRDRKQIWKDDQNLSVNSQDSVNQDNTCRSLARTMLLRMNLGPLKSLPPRKKTSTPELAKGQEPVISTPVVVDQSLTSNEQLRKQTKSLVTEGKRSTAIAMMRDAVDSAPLDMERREDLVNLLLAENPGVAAEEARRSAILLPEKPELRVLAARAWMLAGKPDEAQKDLNEAVARDPNGTGTRLLLGELSLEQLEPEKAVEHLDQVIKQKDSARARFLRAVCRGLLGATEGMQADFATVTKLQGGAVNASDVTERYVLVSDITDRLLSKDGLELRSLIQMVVVKPHNKDLRAEVDTMSRSLQARTTLLADMVPPTDSKQAHERRLLAHKLISQCLLDLQTFSDKGDEDALADSRINLGEALKQMNANKVKK